MSMKLSRRDQVIILVVLVVLVLGLGGWFILKPKYEAMQSSADRLEAKEAEKVQVEEKINTLEGLKETLEKNVKSVESNQKSFISESELGDTQQISQYVMSILEPSGIEIIGMTLNQPTPTKLTAYTYRKNALAYPLKMNADLAHELPDEVYNAYNNSYPSNPPEVQISATVVTVSYLCDPECQQVFDAIQLIADHEKNIYLDTCEAEIVIDDDGTAQGEGALTLTVYEIYPMDPDSIERATEKLAGGTGE